MNLTVAATLAMAGVAILGSMMSMLLLSYRIGRLTGTTETRISAGEDDRSKLWRVVDALDAKLDTHLQGHGS